MKDAATAARFIEDKLGANAANLFSQGVDDFFCYVRHQALFEHDDPSLALAFKSVAEKLVADSVKLFVDENYTSDDGRLEVHITSDTFLDKEMKPIPQIQDVKLKSAAIVDALVQTALEEYEIGRALAFEMDSRIQRFEQKFVGPQITVTKQKPAAPPMDLTANPPMEWLEIEMMRLERRLPLLSTEEGNRLSQLYVQLKVTVKTH